MKKLIQVIIQLLKDIFTTKPVESPKHKPVEKPTDQVVGDVVDVKRSTPANPDFEELAKIVSVDTEQNKRDYLKDIVIKVLKNKSRYLNAEKLTGVPWKLIAAIHFKESSLDFDCMIHNGEPLNIKSRIVPIGVGPFETWEASVVDSFKREGSDKVDNWTFAQQLKFAEKYNGLGYRKHNIYSPYVFGFTNLSEEKGGYPKDHVWDSSYPYKRPGVAAIIIALDYGDGVEKPADTKPVEQPKNKLTREQFNEVVLRIIRGDVKTSHNPYNNWRETNGKNRSEKIDALIKRQGGSLGDAYCQWGQNELVDAICEYLKIDRKKFPYKEGGSTQTVWSETPSKYKKDKANYACNVTWQYNKTWKGHVGYVYDYTHNDILTFEFNTTPNEKDVNRDGEGSGFCIRPNVKSKTIGSNYVETKGFIDIYEMYLDV
jgi:lysozyme family protein